jgi:hypothetical protein
MLTPFAAAPAGLFAILLLLSLGSLAWAAGDTPQRKPVDQLPSVKELPDLFLMANGSRVKTAEEWRQHRQHLGEMVLGYEYGPLPPAVDNLTATVSSVRPATQPADVPGAAESDVVLTMGPGDKVKIHLHLLIPAGAGATANNKGPFPAIIRGDVGPGPIWGPVSPEIASAILQRGYILAEFDRTELVADKKEVKAGGVYDAWPDYHGSAISAWAWGYHRVVDYLLTRGDVDARHIAVTGHSRGGKTTLLAGALDERIALTAPNDSGCGGAGCYRVLGPKAETIEMITRNFPYWFEARFPEFIGHLDRLPFDQHTVKALVAPRAFLETEALDDLHANPQGSEQTFLAAREVFEFLAAADQIGIAWREGKHDQTIVDWVALLDFADWRFFGKNTGRSFGTLAFPDQVKAYHWQKP